MAVELEICERYGIPHSEFLAWDADDRDKAIVHHLRKKAECRRCGTRPDEWDETRGGHRNAYLPGDIRCRGCEVTDAYRSSLPPDVGRGVYVVLKPRRG